ncbi:MAG: hypothetical protein IT374_06020 [Polyangiaceae bacterium]|nr:hypothetical protein [Polyangiaceae bacterium]
MRLLTAGSLVLICLSAYACSTSDEEPAASNTGASAGAAGAEAGGQSGNGGESGQSGEGTGGTGGGGTGGQGGQGGTGGGVAGTGGSTAGGGTGGTGGTGGKGGTGAAGNGASGCDGLYCPDGRYRLGPCPGEKVTACMTAVSGVECVTEGQTCPVFPACDPSVTAGATCVPGTDEDCLVAERTVAQCSAGGTWWVGTMAGAEPPTSACDAHGKWGFTYAEPLDPKADCGSAPLTLEIRSVKGWFAVLVQPAPTSWGVSFFAGGCDARLEAMYPGSAGGPLADSVITVAQLSFADPPSGTYSRAGTAACGFVSTKGTFASFAKQ